MKTFNPAPIMSDNMFVVLLCIGMVFSFTGFAAIGKGERFLGFLSFAAGFSILAGTIKAQINCIKGKREYKKFMMNATVEYVPVKAVITNGSQIGGNMLYRIVADKQYNGEYYVSRFVSFDPKNYIKDGKIKLLTDPADPGYYFIDTVELKKGGALNSIN